RDARLPEQESARIADGRQAIERNPKDAGAYLRLGRVLLQQKDDDSEGEAAAYRRALELYPLSVEAHLAVSQALLDKGRRQNGSSREDVFKAALIIYQKASELAPNNAEVRRSLGDLRLQLNQPDAAMLDLDKAIELDPNDAEAFDLRAQLHRRRDEWEQAR